MAIMAVVRASWNADVDYWTLAIPHILQGMGMPFFFVGLTALAISSVPEDKQTSAAGLMNFLRTLSGAIGTAIATTAWDDAGRTSRSELVSALNDPGRPVARLQGSGSSMAPARAAPARAAAVRAVTLGAAPTHSLT